MKIIASSDKPWYQRLTLRAFAFVTVGVGTFLLDLLMIYIGVNWLGQQQSLVIALSFLIAVHINYTIMKLWVYKRSEEKMSRTYTWFVSVALIASLIIPILTIWIETAFGLNMFLSRVITGALIGIFGFCFNTFFNFKVL